MFKHYLLDACVLDNNNVESTVEPSMWLFLFISNAYPAAQIALKLNSFHISGEDVITLRENPFNKFGLNSTYLTSAAVQLSSIRATH